MLIIGAPNAAREVLEDTLQGDCDSICDDLHGDIDDVMRRRFLQLFCVLTLTGLCTVGVLNRNAEYSRLNLPKEPTIDCAEPVKELSCSIPAFTAEWSIIPGVDIEIYSAHLDDRIKDDSGVRQHTIRTIALLRKSATQIKFFCIVNYPSGAQRSARASVDRIWLDSWDNGSHRDIPTPHILSCNLGDATKESPSSVSIVTDVCACPSNNLRVRKPPSPEGSTHKKGFAVCVKGLFYPKDISASLIQWIEMIHLLGAEHIQFYLYHVHHKTRRTLKFYEKFRQVAVRKLTLPPREYPQGLGFLENFLKTRTWEKRRLELVPYNDCYYRMRNKYEYVVLLDIDEIIVPRDPDTGTWAGVMERIRETEAEAIDKYASFAFTNAYFFRKLGTPIDILQQTERSANLSRPGFAVKSFFTSDGSLAVFNHYTLIPLRAGTRKCAIVGPDIALVHHYRDSCPSKMEEECASNFMKYKTNDMTILKYDVKLREAIAEVKANMKNAIY
ncbi:uncharacterized protein LOC100903675 [Galendromus occidentalis]|uniref:Glycosyltransferase family 92 protein n=1 Tax=Galendromus occidentalis TaxID=34638 RepID=A0AAJ6QK58_9ACAR|nr:uncharacterized protein LOC100903675 [Galendromus occidentalis]